MVIEPAAPGRAASVEEPATRGLDATAQVHAGTCVISLRGVLRAGTATALREAVEKVLAAGPRAVVLDLTDVVADDDLGLWAVPAVAGDADGRGIGFTVVAPDRSLRIRLRRLGARPIEITDVRPEP